MTESRAVFCSLRAVYKIIGRIGAEVLRALERGAHNWRLYYYSFHYNASARFDESRSDPRRVARSNPFAKSELLLLTGREVFPGRRFLRNAVVNDDSFRRSASGRN